VAASWDLGPFGECSSTCGTAGLKTRSVSCKDTRGVTRPDWFCIGVRPVDTYACAILECPVPHPSNAITLGAGERYLLTNTSGASTEIVPGDDCTMTAPAMTCTPSMESTAVYAVKGHGAQSDIVGTISSGSISVKINFAAKPLAEGDFMHVPSMVPGSGEVHVEVIRSLGRTSTLYTPPSGTPVVKVRAGEGGLHVLIDDSRFTDGAAHTSVKLDLAVDP